MMLGPAHVVALFGDYVPADPGFVRQVIDNSPLAPVADADRQRLATIALGMAERMDKQTTREQPARRVFDVHLAQLKAAQPKRQVSGLQVLLTESEAQDLFKSIEALNLGNDCVHEGCNYRSYLGAYELERRGVFSEHALVRTVQGDLYIPTDKSVVGFTLAMNHMAPTIWVLGESGPQRFVIDPAFQSRAVPLSQWQTSMLGCDGKDTELLLFPRHVAHITQVTTSKVGERPSDWDLEEIALSRIWCQQSGTLHEELNGPDFTASLLESLQRMREIFGASVPQPPPS